jgi:WD40 repeat protein
VAYLDCDGWHINDIAWHPGKKWLLVALRYSVQIWSTMDWTLVHEVKQLSFDNVAWFPNGKLFVGGNDHEARVMVSSHLHLSSVLATKSQDVCVCVHQTRREFGVVWPTDHSCERLAVSFLD